MVNKILTLTAAMVFACQGLSMAATTQVDSLVKKLVDKGILTEEEGNNLKSEIAYDEKTLRETNMKKDIPEWVQNAKFTGDVRVRNQYEARKNGSTAQGRNRQRLRARLNFETKVNDQFKAVIGVASNGSSSTTTGARSNNQTFDSTFTKGNVVLNYAYGQYTPNDEWVLSAGQMKNPIYEPMEFLWDGDITPTGASAEYTHKLNDNLTFMALGGGFSVRELSVSNADPMIYIGQAGFKGNLPATKADYKVLGAYQGITNGTRVTLNEAANNTTSSSKYVYRYNVPLVGGEIGYNDPLGEAFPIYIPRMAFFGEFAKNPHPKDESTAWMAGAYLGNSKVASRGAWKLTGAYKSLGRDAWLDALPDSDFYSGVSDVKGYEAIFEYGLAKNVTLGVDYYRTRRKSSLASKNPETIVQTDINLKF